jgi:adenosylcobinamide-GDP ribazoletransferase
VIRPLLIACAFLTRLPVRTHDVRPTEFGAAAACFPLVGFGIGALGLALHAACLQRLGAALTACVLIAWSALITGGLHLDGLADWFDALGGGRGDPKRMLEIMRDPRIGAHGASALVIVLGTKLVALSQLPPTAAPMALLGAPACARWAAVGLSCAFPSARNEGLGQTFAQQVKLRHALIATAFLCAGMIWFGTSVCWPLLLTAAAAAALGVWARARLGGLTGDVHGAAIELCELVFLVSCARSG